MTGALPCCRPWFGPDRAWRHARRCPRDPNGKLGMIDRQALRTSLYLEHVAEREPAQLPQAVGRMATWRAHLVGCDCPDCAYVEAHLDDDR